MRTEKALAGRCCSLHPDAKTLALVTWHKVDPAYSGVRDVDSRQIPEGLTEEQFQRLLQMRTDGIKEEKIQREMARMQREDMEATRKCNHAATKLRTHPREAARV